MIKKLLMTTIALAAAHPALAESNPMAGARLELRVGYETPTVSDGNVYKIGNSASIGGEVGYDLAVSRTVVVGPFANYDYANAKDCSDDGYYCLESHGNFAGGGRVGVAVGRRAQVYGKLGYDSFDLKADVGTATGTKHLSGVMGALGVDVNVSRRLYVGIEGDYADLGHFAGLNFQRRHVALTAGTRF
jgi:outer membrane immunogenic protein